MIPKRGDAQTAKKSGGDFSYELTGAVVNLLGPYPLPSDNKQYLVFGFASGKYNCVFYIRFEDTRASTMAARVAAAMVNQDQIRVSWKTDKPWDKETDPSYVISGVSQPIK